MRIECINSINQIEDLVPSWNEILDRSGYHDVFLLPDWYLSYIRIKKNDSTVRFLLFIDILLVGILPLEFVRQGPFRYIHFLGQPHFIHRADLISLPGIEENCIEHFLKWLSTYNQWDILIFKNFGLFTDNARALIDCCNRHRFRWHREKGSTNYYISLNSCPTFDDYWKSKLSKRTKKMFRNVQNRLNKKKEVSWDIYDHLNPMLMRQIVAIDLKKKFQGAINRSYFDFPGKPSFFKNVLESMDLRGTPLIIVLKIKSVIVSYMIGFRYTKKFFLYQTGYDSRYHKFSPGKQILLKSIETAYNFNIHELDMLTGAQEYKQVFAPDIRHCHNMYIFNRGFRSSLFRFIQFRLKYVINFLSQRFPTVRERFYPYLREKIIGGYRQP